MQYKFFPHTEEDIKLMLDKIGVPSLDALFAEVPEEIRVRRDYDLPSLLVAVCTTITRRLSCHTSFRAPSFSLATRLIRPKYRKAHCITSSNFKA